MSAAQPVIRVRDIVNRFGTQVVHDGVSFDVMSGEIFGIVGGSGSGKSVLLKTILGLRQREPWKLKAMKSPGWQSESFAW